jgi:hypothetical protein
MSKRSPKQAKSKKVIAADPLRLTKLMSGVIDGMAIDGMLYHGIFERPADSRYLELAKYLEDTTYGYIEDPAERQSAAENRALFMIGFTLGRRGL